MEEDLSESLIQWAQTFDVDLPLDSVQALSDGVALSRILHKIAPAFFDEQWLSKVQTDEVFNWRLKVSNLKKILKEIQDYFDEIGLNFNDFQMPNLQAIAESESPVELGKLLQLVLGCAINCENKQDYIQRIMSMEESVQHGVMTAIQALMEKEDSSPHKRRDSVSDPSLSSQLKDTAQELRAVSQVRDELLLRCHELDSQVAALQDEKAGLKHENEKLQEKLLQSADGSDDPLTSSGRRLLQLQQQVEKLKDDTYRLEAARDDYRVKYEQSCRELLEAKLKVDELSKLADEARTLKDEVDVLRNCEHRVIKQEATIETYKKKLEEMADLKRQIKSLEEKNASYVQASVDLEEESKKTGSLKSQLEMFKRQVQELQSKASEETKRADKCMFESRRAHDQLAAAQKEKERLLVERDALRESNEELTCSLMQGRGGSGGGDCTDGSDLDSLEMASLPADVREKIIRLQHENALLKRKRHEGGEEGELMLQSLLDNASARVDELETEKRAANQKVLELEAALDDSRKSMLTMKDRGASGDDGGGAAELRRKLAELSQRCSSSEMELAKKRAYVDSVDARVVELQASLRDKEARLQVREDEMKAHEDTYHKYMSKAQSVITSQQQQLAAVGSGGRGTSDELEQLRSRLMEKERLVAQIQREHERTSSTRDQEEKLMVAAWYNLSMQMEHRAVKERLHQSGGGGSMATQGQSFLARQRLVHTRLPTQPAVSNNR